MKNGESNKDYVPDISSDDNGRVKESTPEKFFSEENNLENQSPQPSQSYQVTQPGLIKENKKENYVGVIPKRSLSKRINRGMIFALICLVVAFGLIQLQVIRQNKEKAEIRKIISEVHPITEKWMFPNKEDSKEIDLYKDVNPENTEKGNEQETSQEGYVIMKAAKTDVDALEDLVFDKTSKENFLEMLSNDYNNTSSGERNVYCENLEIANQKRDKVDFNQDYAVCQVIREYSWDQINFDTGGKTRINKVYYFQYGFYKDENGEWKVDKFGHPSTTEDYMNQGNWEVGY